MYYIENNENNNQKEWEWNEWKMKLLKILWMRRLENGIFTQNVILKTKNCQKLSWTVKESLDLL